MPIDINEPLTDSDRAYLESFKAYSTLLDRPPSVREFAKWMDRSPSVVHRVLAKLCEHGRLVRLGTRQYHFAI